MGYRLSSAAWPAKFVETLAKKFTVITFDNRGTGQSDKPVTGYALANMARDVGGLLDEIGIENTYVVGYSMGGAIAQEFARQFPDRVAGLILCATMCGGPRATYAEASVVRVMRDLDGLSRSRSRDGFGRSPTRRTISGTEPANQPRIRCGARSRCRRRCMPLICNFRHSPNSTARHALSQIKCPTLVLTGDLDKLIPPQNSRILAQTHSGRNACCHSWRRASSLVGSR